MPLGPFQAVASLQVLHMDLLSSGIYSVLPWITMAVSANVGGWIADTLVGKGYSVTLVRKLMQTVSTRLSHLKPSWVTSSPSAVLRGLSSMCAAKISDCTENASLAEQGQEISAQGWERPAMFTACAERTPCRLAGCAS